MPTVADYVVVSDKPAAMVRGGTNFIDKKFTLPQNFNRDKLAIIQFMVDTVEVDHFHYVLRINGHDIVSYTHDTDRFGTLHEVFAPMGIMQPGQNDFRSVATEGEGTVKLGDIFIHFQVDV
jgi:hypothetical protein